jgi:hypothetical protein
VAFSGTKILGGFMTGRRASRATFGVLFGVLGFVLGNLNAMAAERIELPAGPNRDFVARTCEACHDLDNVIGLTGADRDIWDGTIEQMIGFGLSVTPEERALIVEYLSTYLGPKKPAQQNATRQ